ncbi:DUF4224 domain-containing protein [Ramlibacter monticola]|uniref:DUF4224 domain-containing protein n=1 Tax=Ramlibacter monticola TaxID=1926872 RepID=A0A937CVU8_9BURK|nr:DUF4224 domain-containing protein [Ramlibacter monticola]MBL0394158.1 DUF4224 domain-containing protein [Ramlibacter monticola]
MATLPQSSTGASDLYGPDELRQLTDRARAAEQSAWLRQRGIPHQRDGSRVLVARLHVRAWLEGRDTVASEGPNWSALNAPLKRSAQGVAHA